eukprot:6207195-Pleurochrysis_carterae.AAC.4
MGTWLHARELSSCIHGEGVQYNTKILTWRDEGEKESGVEREKKTGENDNGRMGRERNWGGGENSGIYEKENRKVYVW